MVCTLKRNAKIGHIYKTLHRSMDTAYINGGLPVAKLLRLAFTRQSCCCLALAPYPVHLILSVLSVLHCTAPVEHHVKAFLEAVTGHWTFNGHRSRVCFGELLADEGSVLCIKGQFCVYCTLSQRLKRCLVLYAIDRFTRGIRGRLLLS